MAAPKIVWPKRSDPRVTIAAALTFYTALGQSVLPFNREPAQVIACILTACFADILLTRLRTALWIFPLSAYITGLSVGLLLESIDVRVFVIAAIWGIASKHLIRDAQGHFFNPSNFSVVSALILGHGLASVAPGSQWDGRVWLSLFIATLGLVMMWRVGRFAMVSTWIVGYLLMGGLRYALGQGSWMFVIGPMSGPEFALFSFSMLPDPKASPNAPRAATLWAAGLAFTDGVLRYLEVRYSMFYALFAFCGALPLVRRRLPIFRWVSEK